MGGKTVMTDLEIALRVAVNVLRDSVESGKMPSAAPLCPEARDAHAKAIDQLETLLREALEDE
jgi:hypothetical protein